MPIKYSIIIPTYNRAEILQRCLQCICELENPDEHWEVLVFDNNSTDNTKEIICLYKKRILNLRSFKTTDPGLHVGRNLGCQMAKGNILCYIDDDSFVSEGWLKGVEKAFQDPEVVLIGGPCMPEYEVEPPGWLSKMWSITTEEGRTLGSLSLIDVGNEQRWMSPYYVYGCNFSIRKNVLADVGGFHPDSMPKELIRFRGDGETFVSERLSELGYKAVYSPHVKIHHLVPASRMTTDYFCHRAYIQGISSSFAQIREELGRDTEQVGRKGQSAEGKENKDHKFQINGGSICHFLKRGANSIKNRAVRYKKKLFPTEYDRIRADMQKSSEAGFQYHQEEMKKDPKLLEWVLRENYLGENGKLPE